MRFFGFLGNAGGRTRGSGQVSLTIGLVPSDARMRYDKAWTTVRR